MDHSERKEIYFPEYSWDIIKSYLLVKIHPVAKLIKTYSIRYQSPCIFMTKYPKLRNGAYKYSPNRKLDIANSPEEMIGDFQFYLKCKKILLRYCESCKKKSTVFIVDTSPYSLRNKYCVECSEQTTYTADSYLEY